MMLSEIIAGLEIRKIIGSSEIIINDLAYNSNMVKPRSLFFALKGYKTDGHKYISQAIDNGASAIVLENETMMPQNPVRGTTFLLVPDSRCAMAEASANVYSNPSRSLKVIGVTGTNGKTTTTYLIEHILAYQNMGCGIMGTIKTKIADIILPAFNTTPESAEMQRILAQMRECKLNYAVMEASSHALVMQRCHMVEFDIAVFTNLTQDHLDFHSDMEEYYQAKLNLFKQLTENRHKNWQKCAVVNVDDYYGKRICEQCSAAKSRIKLITYAVNSKADVRASNIKVKSSGVSFNVSAFGKTEDFYLKLTGLFNVYNALAAIAVCLNEQIRLSDIKKALEQIAGISGRFQKIECGQNYTVIVDYAHTPDGLKNVLTAAKDFAEKRIITVFGCGGDRDPSKRPLMGEIAARYSDYLFVTSDNPRSEPPAEIIKDIIPGIEKTIEQGHFSADCCKIEPDRRKAIKKAIYFAQCGDIIMIAGKGHEDYQSLADRRIDFDDRKIAAEFIAGRMATEQRRN